MKSGAAFAFLVLFGSPQAAQAQEATHAVHAAGVESARPLAAEPAVPVPTDIKADTGSLGLSTQVTQAGNIHTIDGGTRAGNNLFHSFSRFDLGQGDFARWVHSQGDPASIRNVVNRVTGGDPSHIFGTIDATALPNADFYFINPAGIVFGEGAQVNVPAAAHFSTASELRFSGAAFTIATPGGSTFSVANPAAFGFVGGEGDIAIIGTGRLTTQLNDLSLTAANISIQGARIDASSVQLAATGGEAAEVPLGAHPGGSLAGRIQLAGGADTDTRLSAIGAGGVLIAAGSFEAERAAITTAPEVGGSAGVSIIARDALRLRDARVAIRDATATAGSLILRSGNELVIGSGSSVASDTSAAGAGLPRANGILIEAPSIGIEDANIGTGTSGDQPSGDLIVRGGTIEVRNAFLSSFSLSADAGTIALAAEDAVVLDAARIDTRTFGLSFGSSGHVDVQARSISLMNDTAITNTSFGSALPGSISLRAGQIDLGDSAIRSDVGGLGCEPCGNVNEAGSIFLAADRLSLRSSSITADSRASGRGGLIAIEAAEVDLTDSAISSNAFSDGEAGNLSMNGRILRLDSGRIESTTEGSGSGGVVRLDFEEITLTGPSRIASNAGRPCDAPPCGAQTGDAGDIAIDAARLVLTSDPDGAGPMISSDTYGRGAAGRVTINAPRIVLAGGVISSSTSGSGAGGEIGIVTDTLAMNNARLATNTSGSGAAGSISVVAGRSIALANDARIASNSFGDGSGAGGTIALRAPDISLAGASKLLTETSSGSPAGSISIQGEALDLTGASLISSSTTGTGQGGSLDIDVDQVTVTGSYVTADSLSRGREEGDESGGQAGQLTIRADRLTIQAGNVEDALVRSLVSSSTLTDADAGNVTLAVGELIIDNSALASATQGDGQAGTVTIEARDIALRNGAIISTNSQTVPDCLGCDLTPSGNAGVISISVSGAMSVEDGSAILSGTEALGNAGEIRIAAGDLLLRGGRISTSTGPASTGQSGSIVIEAEVLEMIEAGSIETISRNRNPAGGILIDAGTLLLSGRMARISSSNEFSGLGDAGGIFISADALSLLEGAQLTSSSVAGAAGAIEIFMPATSLLRLESAGPASTINTSSGPGLGGRIFISRPRAIISNGGSILALGQQGGANVEILSQYFINSSDRTNQVAVAGNFLLEAAAYDVSAGTVNRDLSVLDASGVLRGQCAAVRATGQVSQLVVRPIGPYGRPSTSAAPPPGRQLVAAEPGDSCS
ncbi:MAG TPA: filamentous hemagglutinin N-terminal domain-containing protein [Allosphingosinicella sp.]